MPPVNLLQAQKTYVNTMTRHFKVINTRTPLNVNFPTADLWNITKKTLKEIIQYKQILGATTTDIYLIGKELFHPEG